VAIKVSEVTWHLLGIALPMLHFQANSRIPYVSTPSGAAGRSGIHFKKIFAYGDNFLHERGSQVNLVLSGFLEGTCFATF